MKVTIELLGKAPSKKNLYSPRRTGRGRGFYKNKELQAEIDRLAIQIPGQFRDLKLEHPSIDVYFTYCKANWDRTNAWTCIEDLLVEYGVLANDNIAHSNGRITLHPAVKGNYETTLVVLETS